MMMIMMMMMYATSYKFHYTIFTETFSNTGVCDISLVWGRFKQMRSFREIYKKVL